jgi:hypothetical protein
VGVEQTSGLRAPVQGDHRMPKGERGREPGWVAWSEHEAAWEDYARRYGKDQSAQRIADRGGFSYRELVDHLGHEPLTWRPR